MFICGLKLNIFILMYQIRLKPSMIIMLVFIQKWGKEMNRYVTKILMAILMMITLTACSGKSGEKNSVVGKWYFAGANEPQFSLYEDGTCEIRGEYGTGKWSLSDGKELRMTNYYGESETVTLVSVNSEQMVISNGSENQTLYRNPQTANQESASETSNASDNKSDNSDNPFLSIVTKKEDTPESEEPSAEQTQTEQPAETPAVTEPESTLAPVETPVTEIAEDTVVIDEEYVAKAWYTYYMSYLDAINHNGDVSYLKHVSNERIESFKTNYEKYNKGYNFENISFDVDKTDMKIKDMGNGKLQATCHAYAVNVCTEVATGTVEDNRVTLLGTLEFDSETGDYVLTKQQGDNSYSFGNHTMIHCAD